VFFHRRLGTSRRANLDEILIWHLTCVQRYADDAGGGGYIAGILLQRCPNWSILYEIRGGWESMPTWYNGDVAAQRTRRQHCPDVRLSQQKPAHARSPHRQDSIYHGFYHPTIQAFRLPNHPMGCPLPSTSSPHAT
jgi:hypothetical protein